jgi:hypothetical protein
MKYLFLLLTLTTLLFALDKNTIQKHMKDEGHAETFAQMLVDDGSFDDAIEFLTLANKKFKSNTILLAATGQAYLEKNNLEEAKKYFVQVLVLEPINDTIKMKIDFIEEQEAGQKNSNIESILDGLLDKGVDFLMIFLAFLGSEIIARRYKQCNNSHIYKMVDYYLQRKVLVTNKWKYIYLEYKNQDFFTFCFFINLLIIVTMILTVMIVWLLVAFTFEYTFLLDEPLLTAGSETIKIYLLKLFVIFFVVTLFVRAMMTYINIPKDIKVYEAGFVEELDTLLDEKIYPNIYQVVKYLQANGISNQEIRKLFNHYSNEPERIEKYIQEEKR